MKATFQDGIGQLTGLEEVEQPSGHSSQDPMNEGISCTRGVLDVRVPLALQGVRVHV